MQNIFSQTANSWKISFKTNYLNIIHFEDFLDLVADAVTTSEISSKSIEIMPDDYWLVEAFFAHKPDINILNKISNIAKEHQCLIDELSLETIEDKDWVEEVQKNFSPIYVGRFVISPKELASENYEQIFIEASRAFGTGEHYTTKSCIEAMENIAHEPIKNILDVGTGTGILAIAAAKIWKNQVVAVDIEEVSCDIAKKNVEKNNVNNLVQVDISDGYESSLIRDQKFNLIISNILCEPLIRLSNDLSKHLKEDGYVILSGFLDNQQEKIIDCFKSYDILVHDIIKNDSWVTLTLKKN